MKSELRRVRELLRKTIVIMCQNSLLYKKDMKIEGLLGITLDDQEILLVHINEVFQTLGTENGEVEQTDSVVYKDGSRTEEWLEKDEVVIVGGSSRKNNSSISNIGPRVCSPDSRMLALNSQALTPRRQNKIPNPEVDVSIIDREETEPQQPRLQVQNSNPQIQSANPKTQAANSQVQVFNPQIQAANPQVQVSSPQILVSGPQTQAANPLVQVSSPQVHLSNPHPQAANPHTQTANPQVQVFNPQIQAANPQVQVSSPQVHVSNPQIQAVIPQIEATNPQILATNPQFQIFGPQGQQPHAPTETLGQQPEFVPGTPVPLTSDLEQRAVPVTSPTVRRPAVVPLDLQVEEGRDQVKAAVDFVNLCADEVTGRRDDDADVIIMKQSYMDDAKNGPTADSQTDPGTVKHKSTLLNCNGKASSQAYSQQLQDTLDTIYTSTDLRTAPSIGKTQRRSGARGRRGSFPASDQSKCEVCGKVYLSRNSMLRHLKSHDPNLLMCRKCTLFFHSEQALLSHQIVRHKKEGKYTCRICSKKIRYKHQYLLHLRIEHHDVSA